MLPLQAPIWQWAAAGRYGSFEEAAHGSLALFPSPGPTVMAVRSLSALTLSQLLSAGKQAEGFLVASLFSNLCIWVPHFNLERVSLLNEWCFPGPCGIVGVLACTLFLFLSYSQTLECSSKSKKWSVNLPHTVVWRSSLWHREWCFQMGWSY